MNDKTGNATRRCSTAIGVSHTLAALTREQIRYSRSLIAQSLILLRSQRVYPYDPVPQPRAAPQTVTPVASGPSSQPPRVPGE
ncbi:hypothetical protein [Microvirga sesbaniae]|uniref:hypothetical protein n=1 Tax=Microvirga sesbaniae TaxID=681392 RepID=UPI0021C82D64|nr:hypothetical protein [Microvirga sp. HBU67692]